MHLWVGVSEDFGRKQAAAALSRQLLFRFSPAVRESAERLTEGSAVGGILSRMETGSWLRYQTKSLYVEGSRQEHEF
jgi:hypothetical protein